jgi:hypothetical protein
MIRSRRVRAALLFSAAVLSMSAPAVASRANLAYLAGKLVGSEGLTEFGNNTMAVGAVGAGIGTVAVATGVGAAPGAALAAAGTITAGIGG